MEKEVEELRKLGMGRCCKRHAADYSPADYRISLEEVLRIIQFFNAAPGFRFCGDSEDGWCPG